MSENLALEYAKQLIECESVTPARGAVFDALEKILVPLGFDIYRFVEGEAPDGPVENMFAYRDGSQGSRHIGFAGHLDVVPPGEGWESGPFVAEQRGELLYGRGAVDMKGSIACFVAALHRLDGTGPISLIITGDEEGPATYGTKSIITHMQAVKKIPDLCLVGEPTSVNQLGDMMKIGRRGSVNMWITVQGQQGHVAYPDKADNPITKLNAIMTDINALHLDDGTDWFQPSNIEITDLHVGNPAHNVIPAKAEARLSIRFNDQHSGESLTQMIRNVATKHDGDVKAIISGEPFLTQPGEFSDLLGNAISGITGQTAELSTSGGTSDARFLSKICPVVEFGLCNATMHKVDEAVAVADLEKLTDIYEKFVQLASV